MKREQTGSGGFGWWRIVVILVAWVALDAWTLHWPAPFGPADLYPGANPPWYFIRQDLASGIAAGIVLLLTAVLFQATRHRYPRPGGATAMVIPVTVFAVPKAATAAVIIVLCSDLFSPDKAASPWPTFEDYLQGSAKLAGWIAIAAILVALVPFGILWKRRMSD